MISIQLKMAQYYPEEKKHFDQIWYNDNYWDQYILKSCPELSGKMKIDDSELMRKDKRYRKRLI